MNARDYQSLRSDDETRRLLSAARDEDEQAFVFYALAETGCVAVRSVTWRAQWHGCGVPVARPVALGGQDRGDKWGGVGVSEADLHARRSGDLAAA